MSTIRGHADILNEPSTSASMEANYINSKNGTSQSHDEQLFSEDFSCERVSPPLYKERTMSDTEGIIISGCDSKDFERVIAHISNQRIIDIVEMGFGAVHTIRGINLNPALSKMMLENFDLKNFTIKIHGRILSVTYKDFNSLLGLRCRGTEVDLNWPSNDYAVSELKERLCGEDTEISLNKLRHMVVTTYDDDEFWKVCFALYAMTTLICPSRPGYVDPRLLVPLRNSGLIRTHNWAQFAFQKLVEGVAAYQSGQPGPVEGSLYFLQLFYLSVLGQRILMFPMVGLPVKSWGQNECDRMYQRVELLGGFHATEGFWVSKRHLTTRSTEYSGSRDYSTGLKTNVVDDMADLKSNMVDVEVGIESLESIVYTMVPDIVQLRKAMTTLQSKVCLLRTEKGMNDLVRKVKEQVVAQGYDPNLPNCAGRLNDIQDSECDNRHVPLQQIRSESLNLEVTERPMAGNIRPDAAVPTQKRTYCSIIDLSSSNKELALYLFSRKGRSADILGSDEIGRYGDFSVSRWHLKCLSPKQSIRSEIIDLMGAYYFANSPNCWFVPSTFSEHAKELAFNTQAEGDISATITLCRLRRFNGRLHTCRKIFIPIKDAGDDHWFLVVFNVSEGECEIWDSNHDQSCQERREAYVKCAIDLMGIVFAAELSTSPLLALKLSSYGFIYPTSNPMQRNKDESGIYLVRNMQHYGEHWHEGFNVGDQRIKLALEIVNHPLNECVDAVWQGVYREQKERAAEAAGLPVIGGSDSLGDPSMVPCCKKFKPRVPRRS